MREPVSLRMIALLAALSAGGWVLLTLLLMWLGPRALDYAVWSVAVLVEGVR